MNIARKIAFLCVISLVQSIDLNELFSKMTIEDKCGQMTQIECYIFLNRSGPEWTTFDPNMFIMPKLIEALRDKRVGSIIAPPFTGCSKESWQKYIGFIQEAVMNYTRLKIPILYAVDSIHGAHSINDSVLFPQPLSQAATFNPGLVERIGFVTAMEQRAVGVPWNFNPVLDIGRQPLWPRLYETYGEDVHLASRMGESYVKGHQGSGDLKNTTTAATCLKHYIGYSQPTNGFDRTDALIPDTKLREYFLPPFESGVSSGSLTVMLNSAHVNGIPGHANSYYINEILKGELNFQGFVVSDWQDIIRLHTRDKVAQTQEEAVRIAVMAGVDMSMVPQDYSFYEHCVSLSKRDKAFAKRVDDASMRILKVKNELNLFGNPYPNEKDLANIGLKESQQINLDSARESIILAKNDDNTLPLKSTDKILVTGPTGNILRALNGGWSYTWQGDDEEALVTYGRKKFTVYQSISTISESVEYLEGASFTDLTNIDEVIDKAKESDVILLCIGEDSYAETLGNINDLKLSESQLKLGTALLGLNKTVVVVYLGGRPRLFTEIADKVKAVIIGFFPGERGGEAIAEILFGRYIPNGRLPITYPKYPNGYSTYEFYSLPDTDSDDRNYLFPFGHGLSYTSFKYSNLSLSTRELTAPDDLIVCVSVTNSGGFDGKEVVMLFLNDEYASLVRPIRQLKKFEKVELTRGESKSVCFTVTLFDLSFINHMSQRVYEAGRFYVFISDLKQSFELKI